MQRKTITGIIIVILGLLIAIGPFTLFHVCKSDEPDMYMRCYYTARAELGLGVIISILGLITTISSSDKFTAGLSVAVILNSIIVFLIPNLLIGVCDGEHMHCRAVALPALSILSIALFITGFINFIHFGSNKGKIKNEL